MIKLTIKIITMILMALDLIIDNLIGKCDEVITELTKMREERGK